MCVCVCVCILYNVPCTKMFSNIIIYINYKIIIKTEKYSQLKVSRCLASVVEY